MEKEINMHTHSDKTTLFFEHAKKMMHNSKMHEDCNITPDNVYQPAHTSNRDTLLEMTKISHKEGSTILGEDNILKLNELASNGKTCIILSQHVSNLDVPSMFVRFYDHPNQKMKEIFEKIIFVAGVKLNENPLVKLFSEMFSRIVLVPPSSLSKMKDGSEIELAKRINIAAARKLAELRKKGFIFLMYPAGTRYRPWKPETKRGIKETLSYINSFDYFCCCSINGNNMPPKEHEDMTREQYVDDIIVYHFGEVKESKQFISDLTNSQTQFDKDDKENIKQYIVDKIMEEVEERTKKHEAIGRMFVLIDLVPVFGRFHIGLRLEEALALRKKGE